VATIPKVFRLLDALHGGTGLAIGAIATLANTFEVALTTIFNNVSVNIKSTNIDRDGETPTENQFGRVFALTDMDGSAIGAMDSYRLTSGESGIRLIGYAGPNGASVYNTFRVGKLADGTNVYYITDPAAFRSAIGLDNTSWQTLTTNVTYKRNMGWVIVKFNGATYTGSTEQVIGTLPSGYRPTAYIYAALVAGTSNVGPYCAVTTGGDVRLNGRTSGASVYGEVVFPVL
jgi:hypothetical protein